MSARNSQPDSGRTAHLPFRPQRNNQQNSYRLQIVADCPLFAIICDNASRIGTLRAQPVVVQSQEGNPQRPERVSMSFSALNNYCTPWAMIVAGALMYRYGWGGSCKEIADWLIPLIGRHNPEVHVILDGFYEVFAFFDYILGEDHEYVQKLGQVLGNLMPVEPETEEQARRMIGICGARPYIRKLWALNLGSYFKEHPEVIEEYDILFRAVPGVAATIIQGLAELAIQHSAPPAYSRQDPAAAVANHQPSSSAPRPQELPFDRPRDVPQDDPPEYSWSEYEESGDGALLILRERQHPPT